MIPPPVLRTVFLALGAAFLTALSGCERPPAATSQVKTTPPLEVKLIPASLGEVIRSVTLPGEVKAYQAATLYAKVAGYLNSIKVDKGDLVKEGALLAEIEAPELLADLSKYKAEVEIAKVDYQRLSEAREKAPDLVVPLTVDTAKSKLAVAKASLERAQTLLQFTRITAPFGGIVTRRMVDPGAFIPAATTGGGNPQNSALLTLMDFSKVRVQVAVPEAESSWVAQGQPAKVKPEGSVREFSGTITRFAYALDDATRTMLAEIELPNDKLELRPGMYVLVSIGLQKKQNALLLPLEAVLVEKANTFVFMVKENKAKKTQVKTGFHDDKNIEILSGLSESDSVIASTKPPPNDGQPVRVAASR